jgi:hypothetical protein
MAKNKKHITKDLQNFLDYAGNRMNDQDRNAFEKELQKDPFAAEAMEGMSMIDPAAISDDMGALNLHLKRRLTIRKRVMIYRIAAAVAIFLIISASLLTVFYDELGLFPEPVAVTETSVASDEEPAIAVPEEDAVQKPVNSIQELKDVRSISTDKGAGIVREGRKTIAVEEAAPVITEDMDMEILPDENEESINEIQVLESDAEQVTISVTEQDNAPQVMLKQINFADEKNITDEMVGAGTISGIVLSSVNNMPLPGTIINLKGTPISTTTNINGEFEITGLDHNRQILRADFIGMEPQEVILADQKKVRIMMEPSPEATEVVMIRGAGGISEPVSSESARTYRSDDLESMKKYQPAAPVDGYRRFKTYITENLKFPEETELTNAVVVLSFVVNPAGKPGQFNVLMSPGAAFSNEAIRLLLNGPSWLPAQKNGEYLEEETRVRIVFESIN